MKLHEAQTNRQLLQCFYCNGHHVEEDCHCRSVEDLAIQVENHNVLRNNDMKADVLAANNAVDPWFFFLTEDQLEELDEHRWQRAIDYDDLDMAKPFVPPKLKS